MTMTWARSVAILVIVIMAALALNIGLHDSMDHGVGFDTFNAGILHPWQAFINQDLVSGLLLTVSWVVFRQRGGRVIDTVAWAWLALWWGNIIIAGYILVASVQARGDWPRFFMGSRAAGPMRRVWNAPSPILRALCGAAALIVTLYLVRGLLAVHFAPIATTGYVLGFAPIALAFLLLAFPA